MGERTNLKYLSLDKNNLVDLPINMKRMQVCVALYASGCRYVWHCMRPDVALYASS